MRRSALFLLWFAAVWAGVWFGGQLFNALMVVPHFSRNPPESLIAWGQMRFDNLADFFVIFAPIWPFLALLVAFLMGKANPGRIWTLVGAGAAVLCLLILLGWMVPTISRLVRPDHGGLGAAEVARLLKLWTAWNWFRLAIDFLIFASATRALSLASGAQARSAG